MRVSIVIPAHNEEEAIQQALASCLSQTRPADEIIVVNDGSKDKTREIVENIAGENPQIRLLNHGSGHSAAFARNRGAENASGDVMLFFDSDHVIPPETVAEITRSFEAGADAVSYRVVTKPETFIQKCFHANQVSFARKFYGLSERPQDPVCVTSLGMPAPFCFTKKTFEEIGGYDETIFYFEDRMLLKTLLAKSKKITYNPRAVVYHQDPYNLQEFMRQVRFIGKGFATYDNLREKTKIILPGLLWYGIIATLLLAGVSPLFALSAMFLTALFIYETLVRAYYSRDLLHSAGYMLLLSWRGIVLLIPYIKSFSR